VQRLSQQSTNEASKFFGRDYLRDQFTKNKSSRKDKFEWSITVEDVLALWEQQEDDVLCLVCT